MKNWLIFRNLLPELALLLLLIYYWTSTFVSNPVAWLLSSALIFQLLFQKKLSGTVIGGIFVFLSLWMLLAFLSDASKISEFNTKDKNFLIKGICFCLYLLVFSGWMVVKYTFKLSFTNETNKVSSLNTPENNS